MVTILYKFLQKDIVDYVIFEYLSNSREMIIFQKNIVINQLEMLNSLQSSYFDSYQYYIFNKYCRYAKINFWTNKLLIF